MNFMMMYCYMLLLASKKKRKSKSPKKKKTIDEIERDLINVIANDDELLLRIATFQTLKFEEMQSLCKEKEIIISNVNLKKFLDEQGICFKLPEDPNAPKGGPRRVRRKRKRK